MATDNRTLLEIARAYTQPGILVQAKIEGLLPGLLMHNGEAQVLQEQAAEEARKAGRRGKFIPTPEQEAEWGSYRYKEGKYKGALYLPSTNVRRSLVEASKAFKMPKSRASMFKSVAAGVTTPSECSPGFALYDPSDFKKKTPYTEYTLDRQRAVVSKASISRARPLLFPWGCEASFLLDVEAVAPEVFAEILGYAGSRIGVCDMRPELGGEYGRYAVTNLEVIEDLLAEEV